MAITLKYATKAQLVAAFRAKYKAADKQEICRLASILQGWITNGDVTDNQLKNAFGLANDTQLNAFKSRVAAKASLWSDVQSQVGE